jgi:predicted metal-binding membrane protein
MMGLLFYGGVMILYWSTGIAALELLERLLPAGEHHDLAGGIVFIARGLWRLI